MTNDGRAARRTDGRSGSIDEGKEAYDRGDEQRDAPGHYVGDQDSGSGRQMLARKTPEILAPLVAAIRIGGPDAERALTQLLAHLDRRVRRVVTRRAIAAGRDDHFIDDVVQRTLIAVWRSAEYCVATGDTAVLAWVLTIARNAGSDELRADGPYTSSLSDVLADAALAQGFDESVGRRADLDPGQEVVLRLLGEISREFPDDTAAVMWMRVIAGAAWATIGRELHTSATAAKRRYQRAQHTMRRLVWERLGASAVPEWTLARIWLDRHLDGCARISSTGPAPRAKDAGRHRASRP